MCIHSTVWCKNEPSYLYALAFLMHILYAEKVTVSALDYGRPIKKGVCFIHFNVFFFMPAKQRTYYSNKQTKN